MKGHAAYSDSRGDVLPDVMLLQLAQRQGFPMRLGRAGSNCSARSAACSWLTTRCSWVPWHSPHFLSGSSSKTLFITDPFAGPTAGCGQLQSGAGLQC